MLSSLETEVARLKIASAGNSNTGKYIGFEIRKIPLDVHWSGRSKSCEGWMQREINILKTPAKSGISAGEN
jgi:hypothetical protein